jgi:tetratricopeptide (TPR) repeat protein
VDGNSPDATAVALTALGNVYWNRGAYLDAKVQYEAALAKSPSYATARVALETELAADWTLAARSSALLDPGVRRLAIQLARREVTRHPPRDFARWDAEVLKRSSQMFAVERRTHPKHAIWVPLRHDKVDRAPSIR